MPEANDMELLQDYARRGLETAFAELVRRHIALVYSVALRRTGIAAHAEEITQAVFIILARKAAGLRADTILEGWLYETARLTALSFLRGERRRQFREQEAYMQSTLNENSAPDAVWNRLAPLLDEAMARLGQKDRDAVILRFFKDQSVRDVAAALQLSEPAAQRRVLRALEKLRKFFTKRGVSSTTAIIAGTISANSVQAAPVALAKSVMSVAIAKGAAASGSTLTLIKGALKIMAWTKIKTTIVTGVVILLAATTSTIIIKAVKSPKLETRIFKVEPRQFMENLRNAEKSSADVSTINIVADYFAAKGLSLRPPKLIFFNETNGLLFVRASSSDLNAIEKIVQQLTYALPQIHVKVRFIKLPEDEFESVVKAGMALNTNGINTFEIMAANSMASLLAQIKSRGDSETLAEPEVITTSGRQTQLRAGDSSIVDLIPTLLADNYTIKMKVIVSEPETLTAQANVWDRQTLILCSQKTDGKSRLIVFATVDLVDSAGNLLHSKDELPFAQNAVPPQ